MSEVLQSFCWTALLVTAKLFITAPPRLVNTQFLLHHHYHFQGFFLFSACFYLLHSSLSPVGLRQKVCCSNGNYILQSRWQQSMCQRRRYTRCREMKIKKHCMCHFVLWLIFTWIKKIWSYCLCIYTLPPKSVTCGYSVKLQ